MPSNAVMIRPSKEPVKRATPALLQREGIASLAGGNTLSDLDYQTPEDTKRFLTNFTRRIYPLNLPSRCQSTEPYFTPFQTVDNPASNSQSRRKGSRAKHRKHWSLAAEQQNRGEKLPVLKCAAFERDGRQREFGKSEFYDDFIVGGSNYNRGVANPLYQPHVIPINPKTNLRLFTRFHTPSLQPTRPSHSHHLSSIPCSVSTAYVPQSSLRPDQEDVINYDSPALSFIDKMARIQRLASHTMAVLDQGKSGA